MTRRTVVKKFVRDNSTNKIWSPTADETKTWEDAIKYCKALNQMRRPPLGIRNWHLPAENFIVRNNARVLDENNNEFLTAFNNPENEQSGKNEIQWARNKLLLEAFPEMTNASYWSSSSPLNHMATAFNGYDWESFGEATIDYTFPSNRRSVRCVVR